MTDATAPDEVEKPKSGKMPLIIGLVLAIIGGAGGFYAASTGLILGAESKAEPAEEKKEVSRFGDVSFIPMDPLTVSLPSSETYKHLRFRAELEVKKDYQSEVETIVPRIVDVLNSYLRALEITDIEQAASLTRLRAQMLRRVQVVAGPGRITDLLIMEFVLN